MWIKRFHCVNVGPHRELDVELPRGLIGVFGRNGVGKSSFLNLMYACLTNDFGRFPGVKKDCVHDLADPKAESFVKVEAEHGDVEFWLRRGLRPQKQELIVSGVKGTLTNDRQIRDKLDEILGVDPRVLDLFAFKEQNKIYDFLDATDGKRKEAFQQLCGTEGCAVVHDLLGKLLSEDGDVRALVVDNGDELRAALADADAKLAEIEAERAAWVGQRLDDDRKAAAQAVVEKRRRHVYLTEKTEEAEEAVAAAEVELARAVRNHTIRQDKTKEAAEAVADRAEEKVDVVAALRSLTAYAKRRTQRRELEDEAEALRGEAEEHEHDEDAAGQYGAADFDADTARDQRAKLRAALDHARDVLREFKAGRCPTCGTAVEALGDKLDRHRRTVATAPTEIAALDAVLEDHRKRTEALAAFHRWQNGFEARVQANRAALAACDVGAAPKGDEAAMRAALAEIEALEAEHAASEDKLRSRFEALAQAQAARDAAQTRLRSHRQALEDNTVSDKKHERAVARLEQHQAAAAVLAKLDGRAEGLQELRDAKAAELDRLQAKLKRSRRAREMAAVLETARDAVHRNNLPHRVAVKVLNRLDGAINRDLGLFANPFWVASRDDLTFDVHKPGRPAEPSARLSIGQKMVLAMPFWFAWRSDVGMLCLDEPTANLDTENRAYLAAALETLAAGVRGRRQVILVTHDDALRSSFDCVVDLDELSQT